MQCYKIESGFQIGDTVLIGRLGTPVEKEDLEMLEGDPNLATAFGGWGRIARVAHRTVSLHKLEGGYRSDLIGEYKEGEINRSPARGRVRFDNANAQGKIILFGMVLPIKL